MRGTAQLGLVSALATRLLSGTDYSQLLAFAPGGSGLEGTLALPLISADAGLLFCHFCPAVPEGRGWDSGPRIKLGSCEKVEN